MSAASFGSLTDTPLTLVITGARVIDPDGGDSVRDVSVVDGRVADPRAAPAAALRVEAHGWILAPGFVDLHAHLREPGSDGAESIASGARAAARGGFTTVCAMPNTEPPVDDAALVSSLQERARGAACRVRVIAAVTQGRAGAAAVGLPALVAAGAVAVSDDGASVPDALARDALSAAGAAGVPLIEHAEDPAAAAGGVIRAGATALRLGLPGWDPEAERRVVERDIELAEATGARLHLTHISTAGSVDAVRSAKARGVSVTADVTPHHLAMTDAWVAGSRRFAWQNGEAHAGGMDARLAYDGMCRVNPPLPSTEDAEALMEGLRDGIIDAIATDHAPHPTERKLVPFDEAAPGLIGLETALSIGLTAVEAGRLDLATLVAALSWRPAAIIGEGRTLEIGAPADIVLFDPTARWRVERGALASRSSNTPLLGMELPGVVHLTVADGRLTYRSRALAGAH